MKGPTPREPPGNSDDTNPRTRAESWCKTPGVARGGCWRLELTDALSIDHSMTTNSLCCVNVKIEDKKYWKKMIRLSTLLRRLSHTRRKIINLISIMAITQLYNCFKSPGGKNVRFFLNSKASKCLLKLKLASQHMDFWE